MTGFTVTSDGVIEAFAAKLADAPTWMPEIYERHMPDLGGNVADVMEGVIEPNRYTGALQESIISQYDPLAQAVSIYPTVKRGTFDGGAILELGTGPIPNAPWAPIKAWADFRGIDAFPVWWGIREHGVKAHPFLQRTLDDLGTQTAMRGTAERIVADMAIELAAAAALGRKE